MDTNKKLAVTALIISIIALIVSIIFLFVKPDQKSATDQTNPVTVNTLDQADTNQTATTNTNPPATATATTKKLKDKTLGIALDYSSNWTVTNEPSINPNKISHSGVTLTGPEGSVTVLNTTGLGGGPCSAFGADNITLQTNAGPVSLCHKINTDGSETWASANEGPNTLSNGLTVDGNLMAIRVKAKANASGGANRVTVLDVIKSLDTIDVLPGL